MQVPNTAEDWMAISDGFRQRWNFPMCLGALDGKHIVIKKPLLSGSTYYNYKHTFSIQLLAVVDYDYRFLYVDVGTQGRVGDAGVFQNSELFRALENNELGIPEAAPIPGTDVISPYVIVADEAFPLKTYLMKPYAQRGLNQAERIFNYRLSRARRIVENAFGILAARFRVFRAPIEVGPLKVQKIVLAATVLHNFLRVRNQSSMTNIISGSTELSATEHEPDSCVTNGMHSLRRNRHNSKSSLTAKAVRCTLTDYFMNDGQVSWQWNMIQHRQ